MSEQLSSLIKPLAKVFSKRHIFIFTTITALILALVVYSLYDVLTLSSVTQETPTSTVGNFDKKTIEQIKNLRDSENAVTDLVLPTPRPNPFVEK